MDTQSIAVGGVELAREGARFFALPLIVQVAAPVLLFAAASTIAIDPALATLMKANVTGVPADIMRALTDLGIGTGCVVGALLLIIFATIARRAHFAPRFEALFARAQRLSFLFLLSLAASGAIVNLMKILAGRHRPRDLFGRSEYGFEPFQFRHALDSFPSGHSQTIFVVTTVLALALPKRWRSISLAGAMIAATRVVMTNHYLSDVVVGSYIGIAAVLLIAPFVLRQGDAPMLRRPLSRL
ncbi:phosphatase PAP2 family protein [Parvibaculum sedimenti]|uniref:Phosphatase PAP2 family protein n=1 Tax=Parvibaculum sedimenti TaxID=2608632 RepID=A0A6N6VE34_9HYPH|nr:phosphatase PAP2 family protein [Parvibaculum sedimenti]KAB7738810.1 phosphatase PAP2 family protein [Parvibaculum sedimenti]